jgi:hypothetical protein
MEKLSFNSDIKVFGLRVEAFPSGIGEVFDELIKTTGDSAGARDYFGISQCIDGKMVYYATAAEKFTNEAKKYNYEELTIENGEYLARTIYDWRKKTECIKDVFDEIIQHAQVNKTKPAIEWYKDDNEMICLVKMNE